MVGLDSNLIYPILDLIRGEINADKLSKTSEGGEMFSGVPSVKAFKDSKYDEDTYTSFRFTYQSGAFIDLHVIRGSEDTSTYPTEDEQYDEEFYRYFRIVGVAVLLYDINSVLLSSTHLVLNYDNKGGFSGVDIGEVS